MNTNERGSFYASTKRVLGLFTLVRELAQPDEFHHERAFAGVAAVGWEGVAHLKANVETGGLPRDRARYRSQSRAIENFRRSRLTVDADVECDRSEGLDESVGYVQARGYVAG